MKRPAESTEYLRHTFTDAERLQMGADLAASHNRLTAIDEEEAVVKSKFKERRATVEATVGSLSRDLDAGWTMQNIPCRLEWGTPNPTEVSYIRKDTGVVVKVRAMTADEAQEDLPLAAPAPEAVEASVAASEEAVEGFFGTDSTPEPVENLAAEFDHDEEDEDSESDEEEDDSEAEEPETVIVAAGETPVKRGRGRPKGSLKRPQGFNKPTNSTAF